MMFLFESPANVFELSSTASPDRTAAKIASFAKLPPGWHYGHGHAPTTSHIHAALAWRWILQALGFSSTDAFPGAGGEIALTAYANQHDVELTLEADNTLTLIHVYGSEERMELPRANPNQAYEALKKVAGEIWTTSGYYIPNTLTVNKTGSGVWLSKTLQMAPGHPSSTQYALTELERPSAHTFAGTIQTSGVSLLSSGFFPKEFSHREVAFGA